MAGKGPPRNQEGHGEQTDMEGDQSREHDGESGRPEGVFPFVFLSDPKMCSHKKMPA